MAICIDRSITICGKARGGYKATKESNTPSSTLVKTIKDLSFRKRPVKPKTFVYKTSNLFIFERLSSLVFTARISFDKCGYTE